MSEAASTSESGECILCGVTDKRPTSILGEAGCQSIINAGKNRGDELLVSPGQNVHRDCRKDFCHPNQTRQSNYSQDDSKVTSPRTRKSLESKFDFQTNCLFCGTAANTCNKHKQKRKRDVHPVLTLEFQDAIKDICKERNDTWSNEVLGRLEYGRDLPAVEARYHQTCCSNFRSGCQIPKRYISQFKYDIDVSEACSEPKKGRPVNLCKEKAFKQVLSDFEDSESSQLTVNDFVDKMKNLCGEDAYSSVYMKKKILEHYGGDVIITEFEDKQNVVTFKSSAHAILHEFHKNCKMNSEDEKMSIIKTAGKLILSDFKLVTMPTHNYPTSVDIMSTEENMKVLPTTLQHFLHQIIDKKDTSRIIASLGQAILQAAMPRSAPVPLQIGLGVQMHHHFGSKFLIDTLHSLGFCSAYSEVQRFERNAAASQNSLVQTNSDQFVQFVGDNVDHNTGTVDGHNTFHGMGMIATITPKSDLKRIISRTECTTQELIELGKVNVHFYRHELVGEPLLFKKLQVINEDANNTDENFNFLVKICRPLRPETPAWSGIMQAVQRGSYPGQSEVIFLPMIDMNPGDMSCVYSTLTYIAKLARQMNVTAVVTFDQPLYWKAMQIITAEPQESDIKHTVVRLGGFHTEMSFLGCIGKFMENSGLEQVLATVYAPNAVSHMMNGKAVERAVRGHFLVNDALNQLLIQKAFPDIFDVDSENTDADDTDMESESVQETKYTLITLMDETMEEGLDPDAIEKHQMLSDMKTTYDNTKESTRQYRTGALWLQYMEMVDLLKQFLCAERKGDWKSHLQAIAAMLPYFAAAGHNLYLKSCYIYLQNMSELEETHPDIYRAFMNGNHVVRRSNRFWGGLSTDLVIEQVLMRSVKSVGGMTRGRGLSEAQRAQWLLSMPACAEVNNAMQEFTGKSYQTSEQHKEASKAKIARSNKDREIFLDFLRERNPFVEEMPLRNIETGVVAEANMNVEQSKEIGYKIVRDMEQKVVSDYSFKRKNQAITLGAKGNLKVNDEEFTVDPQLLFQRITTVCDHTDTDDDKEKLFQYEMCSYPSSLFDSSGLMREANKPQLATAVWNEEKCGISEVPTDCTYVLDGGSLLQRIPWVNGASFTVICEQYCRFVASHYGKAHIVFDGYASGPSTKDTTHKRRSKGKNGTKICFDAKLPCKTKKESFLLNVENKQNFISLLGESLETAGCTVHHADEDADLLIVLTAVQLSEEIPTVVIGEDTDLLVLLLHHANEQCKGLYFKSDAGVKKRKMWNITATKATLGIDVCHLLPFIHAFSGCDTVSRIYGIGKAQVLKKVVSDPYLIQQAQSFMRESTHAEIERAGEDILIGLYSGNHNESLDKLRYNKYVQKVNTARTVLQVQSLPPSKGAAKYHSYRAYTQVQVWTCKQTAPLDWGWCKQDEMLMPLKCDLPAAPDRLLKVIRCNCKMNCDTRRCTCRKHGLACTISCGDCKGISCSNMKIEGEIEDAIEF